MAKVVNVPALSTQFGLTWEVLGYTRQEVPPRKRQSQRGGATAESESKAFPAGGGTDESGPEVNRQRVAFA